MTGSRTIPSGRCCSASSRGSFAGRGGTPGAPTPRAHPAGARWPLVRRDRGGTRHRHERGGPGGVEGTWPTAPRAAPIPGRPRAVARACRAMLDDMSDLLDSTEGHGTPALETHLAGCRSCRNTLASYQEAGSRLRGAVPLLPLAAMLARVAGTLRACVEVPAAMGTAATVTVAVVAVGGGGGVILASHAVHPTATARAATRPAPRSTPPLVTRTHVPTPSGRSLVVIRTAHARRTASIGGARIVTRAPRETPPGAPALGAGGRQDAGDLRGSADQPGPARIGAGNGRSGPIPRGRFGRATPRSFRRRTPRSSRRRPTPGRRIRTWATPRSHPMRP